MFVSDEKIWEERVTQRHVGLDDKDVASWERIQQQRQGFREWQPGTALFLDSLNPVDENFQRVLDFVAKEDVVLESLPQVDLTPGRYHR